MAAYVCREQGKLAKNLESDSRRGVSWGRGGLECNHDQCVEIREPAGHLHVCSFQALVILKYAVYCSSTTALIGSSKYWRFVPCATKLNSLYLVLPG